MNQEPQFFTSKGGGQYFKREGDKVKIVCLYGFNPSIERTTYDSKLLSALECTPCDEDTFNDAQQQAMILLDLDEPVRRQEIGELIQQTAVRFKQNQASA